MCSIAGAQSATVGKQPTESDTELVSNAVEADGLTTIALAYLAIPNLIFVLGWFSPLPAAGLCTVMSFLVARALCAKSGPYAPRATRGVLLWTGAVSCAWAAFGGGSHFMFANIDWLVRDALLGELVRSEWPVRYGAGDQALVLRSAIGFFLPPALFGKVFGMAHIDLVVYTWTALGVQIFLLLLPLPRQGYWRIVLALMVVVFFSGMDLIGQLLTTGLLPMFPLRLEWWVPASYPSFSAQLLWAPNHCLPIWICSALYLRHREQEESLTVGAAALPMSLIWTPFAAIGLLPFLFLSALHHLKTWKWRRVPWGMILAALTYSLPISLFLLIDFSHIDAATAFTQPPQTAPVPLQALSLDTYFLFVSCEFLLLGLALAPHVRQARAEYWLAIVLLLLIPLVRLGPSNDLALRLSATPLVILLVTSLRTLLGQQKSLPSLTGCLAVTFLLLGAPTAVNELWRAATFPRVPADYRTTLAERQGGLPAAHYVGHVNRYLLRSWLTPPADSGLAR